MKLSNALAELFYILGLLLFIWLCLLGLYFLSLLTANIFMGA